MGSCCSKGIKPQIYYLDEDSLKNAIEYRQKTTIKWLLSNTPDLRNYLFIPQSKPLNSRAYVFPSRPGFRMTSCPVSRRNYHVRVYHSEDRFSRNNKKERLIAMLEQGLKQIECQRNDFSRKNKNLRTTTEPSQIIEERNGEDEIGEFDVMERKALTFESNVPGDPHQVLEIYSEIEKERLLSPLEKAIDSMNNSNNPKNLENPVFRDENKCLESEKCRKNPSDHASLLEETLSITPHDDRQKIYENRPEVKSSRMSDSHRSLKPENTSPNNSSKSHVPSTVSKETPSNPKNSTPENQATIHTKKVFDESMNLNADSQIYNQKPENQTTKFSHKIPDFSQSSEKSKGGPKTYSPLNKERPSAQKTSHKKQVTLQKNLGQDPIYQSLQKEIKKRTPLKDSSYKKFLKELKENPHSKQEKTTERSKSVERTHKKVASMNINKAWIEDGQPKKADKKSKSPFKSKSPLKSKSPFKDPVKLISELRLNEKNRHIKTLHYTINEFIKDVNPSNCLAKTQLKNRLTPEKKKPSFKDISLIYSQQRELKSVAEMNKIKSMIDKNSSFYSQIMKNSQYSSSKKSDVSRNQKNYLDDLYDIRLNDRILDELSQENLLNFKAEEINRDKHEFVTVDDLYFNKHMFCPYAVCEKPKKSHQDSVYDFILKNVKINKKKQ